MIEQRVESVFSPSIDEGPPLELRSVGFMSRQVFMASLAFRNVFGFASGCLFRRIDAVQYRFFTSRLVCVSFGCLTGVSDRQRSDEDRQAPDADSISTS